MVSRCRLLHHVEFTEQHILGLFGAHQLFRERLHMVGPFGKLARQHAIGLHELGVSFRKFSDRCAVRFDLVEPTPCRFDVDFECAHVLDDGQKPRLERVERLDFVVRVRDLGGNAVGCDLESVEIGPTLQLLLESPIDLGAECIQPVQPPLESVDERRTRLQARDLSIER